MVPVGRNALACVLPDNKNAVRVKCSVLDLNSSQLQTCPIEGPGEEQERVAYAGLNSHLLLWIEG